MPGSLERTLGGFDAFNRGDIEAALSGMHPDCEWIVADIFPEPERVYRGHEGVRRFWQMWREVFPDFHTEIEETIEAGDQVIVMAHVVGRGKDSGAEVASPTFAFVWTIKDDLAVRMEMLQTRAEALTAVGMEPDQAG